MQSQVLVLSLVVLSLLSGVLGSGVVVPTLPEKNVEAGVSTRDWVFTYSGGAPFCTQCGGTY